MRVIGVELRLQFHDPKKGPQQKEFVIIPCNTTIHLTKAESGYYAGGANINGTIHTDCGDLDFQTTVPDCFLDPEFTKSRHEIGEKQ